MSAAATGKVSMHSVPMPNPGERNSGQLTAEEADSLLKETVATLTLFEQRVARFSDVAWRTRPVDGGWSAAEVAEHVLLANDRLFAGVLSRQSAEMNPAWNQVASGKEDWIRTVLPSQGKANASAALSTFTGLSKEQVAGSLHDFAARFREFLAQSQDLPLHAITWPHPFLGELSAYQWLLYIRFHTQRHEAQMQRLDAPQQTAP